MSLLLMNYNYNYKIYWIDKRKIYDGKRKATNIHDERNQKFYCSSEWLELRDSYRLNNPLCEHCKLKNVIKPADVVDHKISITDDWNNRLNYNNLQSLCYYCHYLKTKEDKESRKKLLISSITNSYNDFD